MPQLPPVQLLVGETPVSANCRFSGMEVLPKLKAWNRYRHIGQKAQDALEFASLIAKRLRTYYKQERAAYSIAEARSRLSHDRTAELAFVVSLYLPDSTSLLGITLFRRTWGDSLVVDFLATNPKCFAEKSPVRGVGTGLLQAIAHSAEALGAERIWGEATDLSAGFYQKLFSLKQASDLFVISRSSYRTFLLRFSR